MANNLYHRLYRVILQTSPQLKCSLTHQLRQDWLQGLLNRKDDSPVEDIEIPGRPHNPRLVNPREVERRSLASAQGRIVMLHSFAHIEFNAINLALDAAYRFRDMPDDFISDWLLVASEEARHFNCLNEYLHDLGSYYGAYSAHNGLWDMVCKTRHNVLHRMALVPRVMEARGLDVTPGMMEKFRQRGDLRAVDILAFIYNEEIAHVAIGNRWYQYCCDREHLDAKQTFRSLIDAYFAGRLRGPFNWPARLAAGFDEDEIRELENCL